MTGPFTSEADASKCRVSRAEQRRMEVQGLDLCRLGLGTGDMTVGADTVLCATFPPVWFLTVTSNASFSSMF